MTVGCKWLNGVEGFKLISRLEISIKGFGSSFSLPVHVSEKQLRNYCNFSFRKGAGTPEDSIFVFWIIWHQPFLHLLPVL